MDVNQINTYKANTSTGSSSKSSGTGSGSAVDMNMFLKLLSTEMSNQDSMNPMDNTQFISQLAQFTSLQEMQNLSNTASSQYSASIAQYGASFVGKTVHVAAYDSSDKYVEDTGIVTNCDYSTGSPSLIVNGKAYTLSSVMEVVNDSNSNSFQYGASLVGKSVTVNTKDSAGAATTVTGIVSGCNYTSGNVTIVINGNSYNLSAIKSVAQPSDTTPVPTGTSTETGLDDTAKAQA